MSYEPKLYLIKYSVNDEYEDDVFQAEDAYEAINQLHENISNAYVNSVYVKVNLIDGNEEEDNDIQYKYKTIDESGEHPEYAFGIEWSLDLEGVLIQDIKWYETEEERDRIFDESEALDALKIMELKNENN